MIVLRPGWHLIIILQLFMGLANTVELQIGGLDATFFNIGDNDHQSNRLKLIEQISLYHVFALQIRTRYLEETLRKKGIFDKMEEDLQKKHASFKVLPDKYLPYQLKLYVLVFRGDMVEFVDFLPVESDSVYLFAHRPLTAVFHTMDGGKKFTVMLFETTPSEKSRITEFDALSNEIYRIQNIYGYQHGIAVLGSFRKREGLFTKHQAIQKVIDANTPDNAFLLGSMSQALVSGSGTRWSVFEMNAINPYIRPIVEFKINTDLLADTSQPGRHAKSRDLQRSISGAKRGGYSDSRTKFGGTGSGLMNPLLNASWKLGVSTQRGSREQDRHSAIPLARSTSSQAQQTGRMGARSGSMENWNYGVRTRRDSIDQSSLSTIPLAMVASENPETKRMRTRSPSSRPGISLSNVSRYNSATPSPQHGSSLEQSSVDAVHRGGHIPLNTELHREPAGIGEFSAGGFEDAISALQQGRQNEMLDTMLNNIDHMADDFMKTFDGATERSRNPHHDHKLGQLCSEDGNEGRSGSSDSRTKLGGTRSGFLNQYPNTSWNHRVRTQRDFIDQSSLSTIPLAMVASENPETKRMRTRSASSRPGTFLSNVSRYNTATPPYLYPVVKSPANARTTTRTWTRPRSPQHGSSLEQSSVDAVHRGGHIPLNAELHREPAGIGKLPAGGFEDLYPVVKSPAYARTTTRTWTRPRSSQHGSSLEQSSVDAVHRGGHIPLNVDLHREPAGIGDISTGGFEDAVSALQQGRQNEMLDTMLDNIGFMADDFLTSDI